MFLKAPLGGLGGKKPGAFRDKKCRNKESARSSPKAEK